MRKNRRGGHDQKISYVIILYRDEHGNTVAKSFMNTYLVGSQVRVPSPVVPGMVPNLPVVKVRAPELSKTVEVIYRRK